MILFPALVLAAYLDLVFSGIIKLLNSKILLLLIELTSENFLIMTHNSNYEN